MRAPPHPPTPTHHPGAHEEAACIGVVAKLVPERVATLCEPRAVLSIRRARHRRSFSAWYWGRHLCAILSLRLVPVVILIEAWVLGGLQVLELEQRLLLLLLRCVEAFLKRGLRGDTATSCGRSDDVRCWRCGARA